MEEPLDPWPSARQRGPGAGSLLLAAGLGVGIGLLTAPKPGAKTRKQLRKQLGVLGSVALDTLNDRLVPGIEDLGKAGRKAGKKARKRARKRVERLRDAAAAGRETLGDRFQKAKDRWADRAEDWEDDAEDLLDEDTLDEVVARVESAREAVTDDEDHEEDDGGSGFLGLALAIAVGAGLTYLVTSEEAEPTRTRLRDMADDVRRRAEERWDQYQQERAGRQGGAAEAGSPSTGAASLSSDEAPQAS